MCRFSFFVVREEKTKKTLDTRSNLFGLSSDEQISQLRTLVYTKVPRTQRGGKTNNLTPRLSCRSVQYKRGAALCAFLEVPKQPVMCGCCQSPAEGPLSPGCAPTTGGVFDLQECLRQMGHFIIRHVLQNRALLHILVV